MYAPPTTAMPSYAPVHGTAQLPYPSNVNPDIEIPLTSSSRERDLLDSLCELYSIVRTLDSLEKAFQKDALSEGEYENMARRLLGQYQSVMSEEHVRQDVDSQGGIEGWMRHWSVEGRRAVETLKAGLPRTEVYRAPQAQQISQQHYQQQQQQQYSNNNGQPVVSGPSGTAILTATENFITFLDALRLKLVSKSALHPLLADVIQSVNKVTDKDFENRGKIISWLITLNGMRASEELTEEQVGDLVFDIEGAYNGFKSVIS